MSTRSAIRLRKLESDIADLQQAFKDLHNVINQLMVDINETSRKRGPGRPPKVSKPAPNSAKESKPADLPTN